MTPMRSLYSGLVSFWPLCDVYDQAGTGHTLTNNNVAPLTRNPVPPVQNGFGQFNSSSSQYLSLADNALISTGDIDYTICFWFNITSPGGTTQSLVTKEGAAGQREWAVFYNSASTQIAFRVSGDGTALTTVNDTAGGTPASATWIFIRVWHDATGNTINIQTNNNDPVSAAHTTGSFNSTAGLMVGAIVSTAPTNFLTGSVADVGFWKRLLTTQEHVWLYNNGFGRRYPWVNATSPYHLGRGSGTMVRRNRITGVII